MQDLKDPQILQQQLNESRRKIDLIRSVTFELSKVLRLPEKLQNILVILHEKFFINYSMILLPGDDGKSLRVQSSYGYEKDNLGFEVPAGTGIVGLAAVKKIPINITGIRRKKAYLSVDVNNRHQQPVAGPGLDDPESQIAIPLISNNELVAVLLAESYNLNVFSKEDESFLITLSQSIAVSIQNSMLFDNMEALIEKRTEELQRSNQTKDRLFAVISHDLRGPITSFHNVARLLSHYNKQHEAEKIDQLSQRIDLSVTRLNALLDNLLSWALTQTKELNAHLDRLNIAALLTEVAELFQDKLALKNIRLVTEYADCQPVLGDYNLLTAVFRNLLSNAVKYTLRGGEIIIRTLNMEGHALVEIADNGVGIPEDKLPTLFVAHEKKSSPGTDNEKGTGLGLLVAYEFLQLNGGNIEVQSREGQGTIVKVSIPTA